MMITPFQPGVKHPALPALVGRPSALVGRIGGVTRGEHTHEVRVDRERGVVVKRFRMRHGDEAVREWAALTLLARFAPGLAPAPLGSDLNGAAPVIRMSWLPGTTLGAGVVAAEQADALAGALERLWGSVPSVQREYPASIVPASVMLVQRVHGMLAARPEMGHDPVVQRAYAEGAGWLDRERLDRHQPAEQDMVLGHGDANLDNYLWDGDRIRLIDFEDSGPSDRALELGLLTEHLSVWSDGGLDAGDFLGRFGLSRAGQERARDFRRLSALFWLVLLRPGGAAAARNPPGTLERQAERLLGLLG